MKNILILLLIALTFSCSNKKTDKHDVTDEIDKYLKAKVWIMERYQITTHKESCIKNNPNDWAEEVGNPRYILDLLLSVINVSVQTVDIVNSLPPLKDIEGTTETKIVKMYPTPQEDSFSIAAEPEE